MGCGKSVHVVRVCIIRVCFFLKQDGGQNRKVDSCADRRPCLTPLGIKALRTMTGIY